MRRRRCVRPVLALTVLAACAAAWVAARAADEAPVAAAPASGTPDAGSPSSAASSAQTPRATTRAAGRLADRVLVISVDGLRPDMLLRCKTPHMHTLFQ